MKDKRKTLKKLRDFLKQREEIVFAYVFGSFSEGLPHRDIDVGVYVDEKRVSKDEAIDYALELSANTEVNTKINAIDIKVINYMPVGLQYNILKGILLFSRNDELRFEFIEATLKKYFDIYPKRKQILIDILSA